jgi:C-5 cytosine-specific DNA methylase
MITDTLLRGLNAVASTRLQQEETEPPQQDLFEQAEFNDALPAGPSPRFVDLFSGIGGFRIGMTAAGGTCVFTNDWDMYSQRVYAAWFGNKDLSGGDIRDSAIIRKIPAHDVLCAGFPCQPFSIAGVSKRNSLGQAHGFADVKNGSSFFAITRILDEHRSRPANIRVITRRNLPPRMLSACASMDDRT